MSWPARIAFFLILGLGIVLREPGLLGLTHGRYWFDEKFILENAEALGLHGSLTPRSVYYPAMAHLPHAAAFALGDRVLDLLRARGRAAGWELRGEGRAFWHRLRLARHVQALTGILTLLVAFAAARRLFGVEAALWAMLFLAAAPGHLQVSREIKPQVTLTLFVALTLLASVRLKERPGPARAALAGAMVGAAVASNYNAATAGVLVLVALLGSGIGPRRGAGLLVLAGLASVLVFVVLNPCFVLRPNWYIGTLRGFASAYQHKEQLLGLPWPRLASTMGWLLATWFVGIAPGLLFYGSWIPLALGFLRARERGGPAVGAAWDHALLLGYALVHGLFTMHMTRVLLLQHYAPLVLPLCLLAGSAMARLRRGGGLLRAGAVLVLLALLPCGPWSFLRREAISSTEESVLERLRRDPRPAGRLLALGLQPPFARPTLDPDPAARVPGGIVAGSSWVAARADLLRAALSGAGSSAGGAALAEFWFDSRLEPVARVLPDWPRRFGPEIALFRMAEAGSVVVLEQREVPLEAFHVEGQGGEDGTVLWLRERGSVARARTALRVGRGERIEIETIGGGDDSGLARGGRLQASIGPGPARVAHAITPSKLRVQVAGPFPPPPGELSVEIAYSGDPGGRIYFTAVRVRRLVAVDSLDPALLRRRVGEEMLLQRAGL